MSDPTYMNIPEVERISQGFKQASEVLHDVAQVMEQVAKVCESTAFIGAVGVAIVIYWLDSMRPTIERLSVYCEEVSQDIEIAVQNYINGDTDAAGRFG